MATITTAPNQLIFEALERARAARHHMDCRCFLYRSTYVEDCGAGHCCQEERLWQHAISRLLDKLAEPPGADD